MSQAFMKVFLCALTQTWPQHSFIYCRYIVTAGFYANYANYKTIQPFFTETILDSSLFRVGKKISKLQFQNLQDLQKISINFYKISRPYLVPIPNY